MSERRVDRCEAEADRKAVEVREWEVSCLGVEMRQ